jgi:acyl carrier protein
MSDQKREEIRKRLNTVFQDVFDDETLLIEDHMDESHIDEWDSLTNIILIVSVEKEFNVRLDTAKISELKNVGEMITLLLEIF